MGSGLYRYQTHIWGLISIDFVLALCCCTYRHKTPYVSCTYIHTYVVATISRVLKIICGLVSIDTRYTYGVPICVYKKSIETRPEGLISIDFVLALCSCTYRHKAPYVSSTYICTYVCAHLHSAS